MYGIRGVGEAAMIVSIWSVTVLFMCWLPHNPVDLFFLESKTVEDEE